MRKLLAIVVAILCSLVFVLAQESSNGNSGRGHGDGDKAQDRDDHTDNGPIQVGYAVVTPVSLSTNGTNNMVVFETFGLREGTIATQAGVLPTDLTTNAILFIDSQGALSKRLGVAIVNPNAASENVTLTLRDSAGKTLGSTTVSVLSHQQISKFVTELFANQPSVPKDVTGTLSITSTNPVSVVGLRFRQENFSTLPVTNLSSVGMPVPTIATGVGGPGAILLPQFAAGGGWATELVIVNNSASSITVRVDLFKQDGTPLSTPLNNQPAASSFANIVIPPGGVSVLAPRDDKGADDF